jgi:hypothetical protein
MESSSSEWQRRSAIETAKKNAKVKEYTQQSQKNGDVVPAVTKVS